MRQGRVEQRREQRLELKALLRVRRADAAASEDFTDAVTKNISLGGLYFEAEGDERYALHEPVTISVSIPKNESQAFPFTRLVGRSRVVRVETVPSEAGAGRQRRGVALEFGKEILVLTGIPRQG